MNSHDLLEQTNIAFARLRNDPHTWNEELNERRLWETALADGIDAEDYEIAPVLPHVHNDAAVAGKG